MTYLILIVTRWNGKGGRRFACGRARQLAFILLDLLGSSASPLHKS